MKENLGRCKRAGQTTALVLTCGEHILNAANSEELIGSEGIDADVIHCVAVRSPNSVAAHPSVRHLKRFLDKEHEVRRGSLWFKVSWRWQLQRVSRIWHSEGSSVWSRAWVAPEP